MISHNNSIQNDLLFLILQLCFLSSQYYVMCTVNFIQICTFFNIPHNKISGGITLHCFCPVILKCLGKVVIQIRTDIMTMLGMNKNDILTVLGICFISEQNIENLELCPYIKLSRFPVIAF